MDLKVGLHIRLHSTGATGARYTRDTGITGANWSDGPEDSRNSRRPRVTGCNCIHKEYKGYKEHNTEWKYRCNRSNWSGITGPTGIIYPTGITGPSGGPPIRRGRLVQYNGRHRVEVQVRLEQLGILSYRKHRDNRSNGKYISDWKHGSTGFARNPRDSRATHPTYPRISAGYSRYSHLTGVTGEQGIQGVQGIQGATGATGITPQGIQGL